MNRRWKERRNQGRRGAVTVEMALVLPIFTMLVFGIIEFGRGFMIMPLMTKAAREGCRRAIIDGNTNSDVTNYIQTFMQTSGNVPTSATTITVKVNIPFSAVQLVTAKYLAGKTLTGQAAMRHE